jgi:membrane fusion protein, multidrug efflux system
MNNSKMLYAAAALLALTACEEQGPRIDVESAIPVRIEAVSRRPIAEYVSATGTVKPLQEAVLKAQQGGRYQLQINPRTDRPYAMGDQVSVGELLVELVNEEYVNQVALDAKELQFSSAQRENEKQQSLYSMGGITLRERTDAERVLIDARYAFENAQLQLAKLNAVSPLDGAVAALPHYSTGQLLEAGADLFTIMDCEELYTDVALPGKEISRVQPGQAVLVTHYGAAEPDTLTGIVAQAAPVLDAQSRMFAARMRVDNDSLKLRPGMFVKLDVIVVQRDSALVVDRDIVIDKDGRKTVFIVEKGIALERRLEIGLGNREQVEVLSGLEEGEQLVVEGFETLRNRAKVKIER